MTSISSMETITPDVHLHFPSSPSDDEDLGRRRIWEDGDESHSAGVSTSKGKQKDSSDGEGSEEPGSTGVYPPTNDDEAETRRIEENLRQWQIHEMQKRKAARESTAAAAKSSRTSSEPGWRASSLWPKSNLRQRELGKHTALGSEDSIEHLPLDNLVTTPGPSPSPSPAPSPRRPDMEEDPQNPFVNPSVSPFADSQQITAVMSPSDHPSTDPEPTTVLTSTPEPPTLLAKSLSFSRPPPPRPLNLPPPKSPPPPVDIPPRAISPLTTTSQPRPHQEPEKETRWWHEWLCGCGEDREADNQVGVDSSFAVQRSSVAGGTDQPI
ncbi:hypothetical protein D9757_004299 [Collybiopsis confluens]|uniref:Uncharacterized protein n=1 Tax=Collybiopsis confluens TaxID=2823264 RepID=A0A8H5MCZ6_9AGAR|nr:hypothetical protein D9757_004299 [Collybiopsis confluens]